MSLQLPLMFKCQVLWKLFICLIISRWRSHFYDHWCHPVFLLIPCIFSGTVAKNEKHFPSFSYGIPYNTTVTKDPNDVFLLWVWHQKLFHLYTSSCNWNCFLIHRYIYFPVFFLLLLLFLFKHTNIIQIFKFTSEKRGGKYAFCINWVNIHIYKSACFICRNDRQIPTMWPTFYFSFLYVFLILFLYTQLYVFKCISCFFSHFRQVLHGWRFDNFMAHYYKFYGNHEENLKVKFAAGKL